MWIIMLLGGWGVVDRAIQVLSETGLDTCPRGGGRFWVVGVVKIRRAFGSGMDEVCISQLDR